MSHERGCSNQPKRLHAVLGSVDKRTSQRSLLWTSCASIQVRRTRVHRLRTISTLHVKNTEDGLICKGHRHPFVGCPILPTYCNSRTESVVSPSGRPCLLYVTIFYVGEELRPLLRSCGRAAGSNKGSGDALGRRSVSLFFRKKYSSKHAGACTNAFSLFSVKSFVQDTFAR